MARAARVLSRSGGAAHRWPARTASAAVRTQRRSAARAAGRGHHAVERRIRGAPRAVLEGRVRAWHQLAGAARARRASRAYELPRPGLRADVRAAGEPAVRDRPVPERAFLAERARPADRPAEDSGRRSDRAGGGRWRAGRVGPRLRTHARGTRPG